MKGEELSIPGREEASCMRMTAIAGAAGVILFCGMLVARVGAASVEIPPAIEKKTVVLQQSYQDAGRVFAARCGYCHAAPDPAQLDRAKAGCSKGIPESDLATVRTYSADVRAGKGLYESHCGRCHDLIDPSSHTADYWSKNLCTSDECFVKKLHGEEEQLLLLYVSSHAKNK